MGNLIGYLATAVNVVLSSPCAGPSPRIKISLFLKIFLLFLHYNGSNNFLSLNAAIVYQFKSKDSEIKDSILCLGNILKNFTIDNMKKKNRFKRNYKSFFLLILMLLIVMI